MQTSQIERGAVEAMHNRAKQRLLTQAWLGKADGLRFAQGALSELGALLNSKGPAFVAARDASMGGYQPLAGFEAAWAALPINAKNFTVAEVQEFLRFHGVKPAPDAVSNLRIDAIGDLENGKVSAVDLDDEHDAARAESDDGAGLHWAPLEVVGADIVADGMQVGDTFLPKPTAREAAPDLLQAALLAAAVLAKGRWVDGSTDPEAVALRALRDAITKAGGEVPA